MTYTVGVRDSIMIAHSFKGDEFGAAQRLHGATYTVDVEFCCERLEIGKNWVIDIGKAFDILNKVLSFYNYHNLDTIEELKNENTTIEFMCHKIFDDIKKELHEFSWKGKVKVKISESFKAWGSYEGKIGDE